MAQEQSLETFIQMTKKTSFSKLQLNRSNRAVEYKSSCGDKRVRDRSGKLARSFPDKTMLEGNTKEVVS